METIIGIVVGILSSFLASGIFLIYINRLKPKIEISPEISYYKDETETFYYVIKILNKGKRNVINVKVKLSIIKEIIISGGRVNRAKKLNLKTDEIVCIPLYSKKDTDAKYAFRIRCSDNLKEIWSNEKNSYLRFRVIAEDTISGSTEVFEMKYFTHSCIQEGQFEWGDSFKIKN